MKKLFFAALCCGLLASCSISKPITATSNPTGNKCGESSYTIWLGFIGSPNADGSINTAAKKAGISRISHVDQNVKNCLIFKKYITRVYGE